MCRVLYSQYAYSELLFNLFTEMLYALHNTVHVPVVNAFSVIECLSFELEEQSERCLSAVR